VATGVTGSRSRCTLREVSFYDEMHLVGLRNDEGRALIVNCLSICLPSDDIDILIAGVWSVVTVVPSGYREFCYNVDGEFTVSRKHPTNVDGTYNWRTVYGPPARTAPLVPQSHWFVRFSESMAESVHGVIAPRAWTRRRGADVEAHVRTAKKRARSWVARPLRVAIFCIAMYGVGTVAYVAWNHAA
jgi:hypothetical protein